MESLQFPNPEKHEIALRSDTDQTAIRLLPPVGTSQGYLDEADFNLWLEYWQMLVRHRLTLLSAVLLGAVVGLTISLYEVPLYRAHTTIEVQGPQEPFTSVPSADGATNPYIQTQVQLLESRTLLKRVRSKMTPKEQPTTDAAPEYLGSWRKALRLPPPPELVPWGTAVMEAEQNLKVLAAQESRILKIQSDSSDPEVASDFVNKLASEYIQQNLEERWEAYQNTGEWLTRAQEQLKTKLENSEEELLRFARASGLMFTSDTENASELKLKQLQQDLSRAQVDRIAKQSIYESSISGESESLPEVLDNGPMAQYQVRLADLGRQLAELSASLTPEHYKVKRLQAQISELEGTQARERGNIIKRIRIEYEGAMRREQQLAAAYAAQARLVSEQAGKLINYKILKREVDTSRQLYEMTLQKGKEASIASAMRASNVRVIDPATPAPGPYKPNLATNVVLGLMGGSFMGALFVFVRERLSTSVKVPGSLPLYLHVRELGVIPSASIDPDLRLMKGWNDLHLSGGPKRHKLSSGNILFGENGPGVGRRRAVECLARVTWALNPSVIAEAFRATMASILFSGQSGKRPQVILTTSPSPKEGKSTITSNLAIALSEINQRVLIIDGDMRRPQIHRIFDVANSWGLSDVLQERTPIHEYAAQSLVRQTDIPGLSILPSGPARVGISRMLYSSRMTELIQRLRQEFDTVLIDTAPTLSVPDARILARITDGVILVIRASQTKLDTTLAALKCFEDDGTTVLGTVLNDWNPRKMGYGYYGTRYPQYYHYRGNGN